MNNEEIAELKIAFLKANKDTKEEMFNDLLQKYAELRKLKNNGSNMPSKADVDALSSMLDLVNKIDESTIEKLSKFNDREK